MRQKHPRGTWSSHKMSGHLSEISSMDRTVNYKSPLSLEQGLNTNYLYLSPKESFTPSSSPVLPCRGNLCVVAHVHWRCDHGIQQAACYCGCWKIPLSFVFLSHSNALWWTSLLKLGCHFVLKINSNSFERPQFPMQSFLELLASKKLNLALKMREIKTFSNHLWSKI